MRRAGLPPYQITCRKDPDRGDLLRLRHHVHRDLQPVLSGPTLRNISRSTWSLLRSSSSRRRVTPRTSIPGRKRPPSGLTGQVEEDYGMRYNRIPLHCFSYTRMLRRVRAGPSCLAGPSRISSPSTPSARTNDLRAIKCPHLLDGFDF